jgi:Ankyrin repeats (3 copies)
MASVLPSSGCGRERRCPVRSAVGTHFIPTNACQFGLTFRLNQRNNQSSGAIMKSTTTLFRKLGHSPIFRRAAILLAALALCGLASCGKDDQAPGSSGPPRNAGGSPDVNAELENAAITGDLEKLKAMFKADPRLMAHRGGGGGTLLHMAADGGQKEVAEFLLAGGADVNARNNGGGTPLHRAAAAGSKDVAELLIAKGADVNARNGSRQTPLHRAVTAGKDDVAEFLRQHGGTE